MSVDALLGTTANSMAGQLQNLAIHQPPASRTCRRAALHPLLVVQVASSAESLAPPHEVPGLPTGARAGSTSWDDAFRSGLLKVGRRNVGISDEKPRPHANGSKRGRGERTTLFGSQMSGSQPVPRCAAMILSASATTCSTISPAGGMSWISAQASPAITPAMSKSPRSRASE